jgi:hypothetical protein
MQFVNDAEANESSAVNECIARQKDKRYLAATAGGWGVQTPRTNESSAAESFVGTQWAFDCC